MSLSRSMGPGTRRQNTHTEEPMADKDKDKTPEIATLADLKEKAPEIYEEAVAEAREEAMAEARETVNAEILKAKDMVEIRIIRSTVVDKRWQPSGMVVATSKKTAALLIGMKKAVPIKTEAEKPTERDTEVAGGLTTRNSGALVG